MLKYFKIFYLNLLQIIELELKQEISDGSISSPMIGQFSQFLGIHWLTQTNMQKVATTIILSRVTKAPKSAEDGWSKNDA